MRGYHRSNEPQQPTRAKPRGAQRPRRSAMTITRIQGVEVSGPHSLRLEFSDGLKKSVNVLPLLRGPVFEPLLNPVYFGRVLLDPVAGTVVWQNGADLAPEALYGLPEACPPRTRQRGDRPTRDCSGRAASRPIAEPAAGARRATHLAGRAGESLPHSRQDRAHQGA